MGKIKYLILILTSLFFYGCSVVPITGRSSFNITNDNEILSLSQQQYKQFLHSNQVDNNSPSNIRALNVAKRLAVVADSYLRQNNYKDLANSLNWEFNIVRSPQVNAFCMPGGKVVIYTGLISLVGNGPNSDAMLAAVVGHEIGHALARHANERMSNKMLIGIGAQALGVATNNQSEIMKALIGYSYNVGSSLFVALPFNRKQEYEADKMGMVLMAMAGYNPKYASDLWHKMAAKGGGKTPELLSTHPSDEHRIEEIEKYLPEAMKYYKSSK